MPSIVEALEELDIEYPRDNKIACPACGSETSPALHLYEDHFYCFSCGKNGDGLGLIALYTGQNIRTLVAQRGKGRKFRAKPKKLQSAGVARAVYVQWRELHDWWFRVLHDAYKGSEMWAFERALDLWSDVFDDLTSQIRGFDGYEQLAPFEAEAKLVALGRELEAAEPFERRWANETRMR